MDQANSSNDQMFQGNWKCAGCGATITELPFEPDGQRKLYCKDCYRSQRQNSRGDGGRQRQMFQGNWKCVDCGAEITELPFEPREGQEIRCRECYRKNR